MDVGYVVGLTNAGRACWRRSRTRRCWCRVWGRRGRPGGAGGGDRSAPSVINVSRGILYAGDDRSFGERAADWAGGSGCGRGSLRWSVVVAKSVDSRWLSGWSRLSGWQGMGNRPKRAARGPLLGAAAAEGLAGAQLPVSCATAWCRGYSSGRTGMHSAPVLDPPEDGRVRVTWIGHATFFVQFAGHSVVIDPNWAKWHGVVKRQRRPGVAAGGVAGGGPGAGDPRAFRPPPQAEPEDPAGARGDRGAAGQRLTGAPARVSRRSTR